MGVIRYYICNPLHTVMLDSLILEIGFRARALEHTRARDKKQPFTSTDNVYVHEKQRDD